MNVELLYEKNYALIDIWYIFQNSISLGLTNRCPFHQIFVKFGNFYFKRMLNQVADENSALLFLKI